MIPPPTPIADDVVVFIPPDDATKRYPLFGSGGGQLLAHEAQVPLLAQLPLEMPVREGGDSGIPVVLSAPHTATARAFVALAERLAVPVAA